MSPSESTELNKFNCHPEEAKGVTWEDKFILNTAESMWFSRVYEFIFTLMSPGEFDW